MAVMFFALYKCANVIKIRIHFIYSLQSFIIDSLLIH